MKIFGININLFPKSLGSDYEDDVVLKKVEKSEKNKDIKNIDVNKKTIDTNDKDLDEWEMIGQKDKNEIIKDEIKEEAVKFSKEQKEAIWFKYSVLSRLKSHVTSTYPRDEKLNKVCQDFETSYSSDTKKLLNTSIKELKEDLNTRLKAFQKGTVDMMLEEFESLLKEEHPTYTKAYALFALMEYVHTIYPKSKELHFTVGTFFDNNYNFTNRTSFTEMKDELSKKLEKTCLKEIHAL